MVAYTCSPVLWRWRQEEDLGFKTILSYATSVKPAWVVWQPKQTGEWAKRFNHEHKEVPLSLYQTSKVILSAGQTSKINPLQNLLLSTANKQIKNSEERSPVGSSGHYYMNIWQGLAEFNNWRIGQTGEMVIRNWLRTCFFRQEIVAPNNCAKPRKLKLLYICVRGFKESWEGPGSMVTSQSKGG